MNPPHCPGTRACFLDRPHTRSKAAPWPRACGFSGWPKHVTQRGVRRPGRSDAPPVQPSRAHRATGRTPSAASSSRGTDTSPKDARGAITRRGSIAGAGVVGRTGPARRRWRGRFGLKGRAGADCGRAFCQSPSRQRRGCAVLAPVGRAYRGAVLCRMGRQGVFDSARRGRMFRVAVAVNGTCRVGGREWKCREAGPLPVAGERRGRSCRQPWVWSSPGRAHQRLPKR
jgi:hypothetical protein